ncbi:neocarzinostatin apoprotein domain-containing protein [Nocardia sp. NPDC051321]|uniref:neocarzinostatin apoprotein domain-containing protein n=1 Tax=Nocardia sp. NPDC051321 TaxID=3364323 RepID=UPI00378C6887
MMIRIRYLAVAFAVPLCALPVSARADAGPAQLRVSAHTELTDGQRITVEGTGFRPGLAAVAVGLCKAGFTNGLRDCDLDGGATFVNIGADGGFGTVTLTVRPAFKGINCAEQRCVIAAAPLPGSEPAAVIADNSAAVPVSFAGASPPASVATAAAPAVAAADADTAGPSALLWAVTAGLLALVAALALADRRRL